MKNALGLIFWFELLYELKLRTSIINNSEGFIPQKQAFFGYIKLWIPLNR